MPPHSHYSKKEVAAIFARLQTQNPNPKTELNYVNDFTLLVAVVLSAQATDVGVNKATAELFKIATSPQDILALGIDKLRHHIKSIGLYQTKAKNVMALSEILVEKHNSQVPQSREALEALPGVGRKTANVVLNTAFGLPTLAVDTHIFRLGNRLQLAPGKNVLEVEKAFLKIIPKEFKRHAHHWLILHGRYICKARTPDCGNCIIVDLCKSKEKNI